MEETGDIFLQQLLWLCTMYLNSMNEIELRIDYMSLRINKLEQFSDPDDTQNFSFFLYVYKITLLKYRLGRRRNI